MQTADGRGAKGKVAQQVLQLLRKGATYEDKTKALCAKREVMHQTKQRMLSQAADEHAIPFVIGLEIHRVRMLVQTCASIPELHDLRWAPIGDLLPQPSVKSATVQFPGLRSLRNACFLNAVCQCMIHVLSVRKRLRASEAVRALLPREELALSFERLIE